MNNEAWNAFIDSLGAAERAIVTTVAEHFSDIAAKFGARILEKQEVIDGKLDQVLAAVNGFAVRVAVVEDRLIALEQRIAALEQRDRASSEP